MKIVVCIKPVNPELLYPNEIRNEPVLMNPYDMYALEECVSLKEKIECTITCLCMGALSAQSMLTKALAMGADEAILLSDTVFKGSDTVATSYILSKAISRIEDVDLVVCGEKTIDGETGQVVYGLGERRGYPCVSCVEHLLGADNVKKKIVVQLNDNMQIIKAEVKLPAVISFNNVRLNQPNVSLIALKKAKRKEISVLDAVSIDADLNKCGLKGSKTKVLNVEGKFAKKNNHALEGTVSEKAGVILDMIKR